MVRRGWGRRRFRGRPQSCGCGSHWSHNGEASGWQVQDGSRTDWQATAEKGRYMSAGSQERGSERYGGKGSAVALTARVAGPMPWGKVGAGPGAGAAFQPALSLPQLILVRGPRRCRLPWLQPESAFAFPSQRESHRRSQGCCPAGLPPLPTLSQLATPLTGVTFTVLILFPEEAITVEACHLVARLNVP